LARGRVEAAAVGSRAQRGGVWNSRLRCSVRSKTVMSLSVELEGECARCKGDDVQGSKKEVERERDRDMLLNMKPWWIEIATSKYLRSPRPRESPDHHERRVIERCGVIRRFVWVGGE
jgi:hypothetical protein